MLDPRVIELVWIGEKDKLNMNLGLSDLIIVSIMRISDRIPAIIGRTTEEDS